MAWFTNHYHCDACDESWQDEGDRTRNDRCPSCRAEIEPHESEDADDTGETAPQLGRVDCNRGAPMGRHGSPVGTVPRRKVYLRRVRLNSGGYDSGGAYWGRGQPLFWATDGALDGYEAFFRAPSREEAKCKVHAALTGTDVRFYR